MSSAPLEPGRRRTRRPKLTPEASASAEVSTRGDQREHHRRPRDGRAFPRCRCSPPGRVADEVRAACVREENSVPPCTSSVRSLRPRWSSTRTASLRLLRPGLRLGRRGDEGGRSISANILAIVVVVSAVATVLPEPHAAKRAGDDDWIEARFTSSRSASRRSTSVGVAANAPPRLVSSRPTWPWSLLGPRSCERLRAVARSAGSSNLLRQHARTGAGSAITVLRRLRRRHSSR